MALLLIILFSGLFVNTFVNWGTFHHPFIMDVNQYYSYLNAVFFERDLTFRNNPNGYWLIETPIHHFMPKVTYGMAFFYSPFYLLAKLFAAKGSTGYELIYAWSIHIGCMVYILVGLNYVRKTLLIWFNDKITAVSLLLLFFGTNLFYYTVSESESAHGILFFLIAAFIYYTIKWHQTNSKKVYCVLMLLAGFITLIRPTESIVLLFPLLIGVSSIDSLKTKLKKFIDLKWILLLGLVLFLVPIFPQLFYWKMRAGQWLFFSYGSSEGFFWNDPEIINVLFSYRKGWFVYTPLMLLSLIGIILMYKKNRDLFFSILIYFLLNLYLISSWWDWAFGGSFGMRAFVHSYAIFIIPFAFVIQWLLEKTKSKILLVIVGVIFLFLCFLNIFQSNLYKHGIIHYDGMTKKAYWFTFMKKNYSNKELLHLKDLIKHPNYETMRQGKRNK